MNISKIDLSIIVPLYNAEKTLDTCLSSICNQKDFALEVILVNDGSYDATHTMCVKYCEKDSRIKYVLRENGGVAAARNSGLSIATGRYVTFVDQDDWIEKGAYVKLIKIAKSNCADMVVFGYSKDVDGCEISMENRGIIPTIISEKEDLIRYAFFREEYRNFAAFVWNKVFKREYLKKNNITFDSTLRRGDDVLFYSTVASYSPKTVYIDKCYYHYVQREDSVVHTLTKENIERLGEILIGYDKAMKLLVENQFSQKVLSYMKCFYVFHASNLYEIACKFEMQERGNFYKEKMIKYIKEYRSQNEAYPERIQRINDLIKQKEI